MTHKKPKPIKPVGDMTPEEREVETVRRYEEAIEAAKSGVLKKRGVKPELAMKPDSDETIPGR